MIEGILEQLRQSTQLNVHNGWRVSDYFTGDISTWPIGSLNEKNYLIWAKGQKVFWAAQTITVPETLFLYPLQGMVLRLKLTWWAHNAKVYVNGSLIQEGDLFDSSARILLSNSVSSGDTFTVVLRLVSPQHDIGGLMQAVCLYENDYPDLVEPSFLADELTVLNDYLQKFVPEKLKFLSNCLASVDWQYSLADKQIFAKVVENIRAELKPLGSLLKKYSLNLLGHAHLDLAWLWPVEETWQVAHKTFTSVLNLQKDYHELIFGHTSAYLYQWLEINQNEQFKAIQKAVQEGRWEILGGMWVEPELNLVQGESLVRQLLYGQEYFLQKFGSPCQVAWLPDSFGFTWQLPQIFKLSGIKYFVTGKLHWNDTSKFPYGLFNWQGPDGSQIVTLMSPPNVAGVMDTNPIAMSQYAWNWSEQTGLNDALWLPGVGDHGGGPSRDMLEVQRRWQKSTFFPQVNFTSAQKYLEQIDVSNLPIWSNELYLEFHRGCYTTHAKQKQSNRFSESLLQQAELWSSLVCLLKIDNYYPDLLLEEAWKNILFNQFHDILPGTSIKEVFTLANVMWQQTKEIGQKILKDALEKIAASIIFPEAPMPEAKPFVIFNSLNTLRSELITLKLENYQICNFKGEVVERQYSWEGELLFLAQDLPPIGYCIYWLCPITEQRQIIPEQAEYILNNGILRVVVNQNTGELDSVYDLLEEKEILRDSGNQLRAFQDQGQYWDAWNIDPKYSQYPLERTKLESIKFLEAGPLRWRIKVIRSFRNSLLEQDYCLILNSSVLTIKNKIDWQEEHILLKATFPLNLESEKVAYEIACATIERPQNSTKQWEVPAIGWASIFDSTLNYGVSLLNDCKYGYDASNNTISLSLLRGSRWPDPSADLGIHEFNYAVYPHRGSWQDSRTLQYGRQFNSPCLIVSKLPVSQFKPFLSPNRSLFGWSNENLILMSLKQSQSKEKWILRIYEGEGKESKMEIESQENLVIKESLDCLENPIELSQWIHPWQIATYNISSN